MDVRACGILNEVRNGDGSGFVRMPSVVVTDGRRADSRHGTGSLDCGHERKLYTMRLHAGQPPAGLTAADQAQTVRHTRNGQWLSEPNGRGGGVVLFPLSAWEGGEGQINREGALCYGSRTKKRREAAMHPAAAATAAVAAGSPACKQHDAGKAYPEGCV
jgi:hypothetical protein